ncbi:MAG TPA: ribose 5-phosphate isomerase B [bacterium (Candidatus Stahlbacteria)]|nr:ribose 5-phosphate isomerase B [Candidatus Stahlbacteria bacterium]
MKVAIGSDHRGFRLKKEIKIWLEETGVEVFDLGPDSEESCDYPDFAFPVGEKVQKGESDYGILICYTGIGMTMAAGKVKGVRPALCRTPDDAHMTRAHNDANLLVIAARDQNLNSFKGIWTEWIKTPFEGGRHKRRVDKINAYED